MDTYEVALSGGDSGEVLRLHSEFEGEDDCALTAHFRGSVIRRVNADFFGCLCDVRLELERVGVIPICYGASENVFPSRMARDMGAGLRAYKLTLGVHAKLSDLVGIFQSGSDVVPATVAAQRAWYEKWTRHPRL